MTKTYIHHPREGYSGPATIGRQTLDFVDGVAVHDGRGTVAGWRHAGYVLSGREERPEVATFDPSSATVKVVLARLEDPEVTDVERDRILSAEREGKSRKTILEWTPEVPEVTDEDEDEGDPGDADA